VITRRLLIEKIVAHLNGGLSEQGLVDWAEGALVALTESDHEAPDEALLMDVLAYLGVGDSPDFPLSWSVLSEFLERLGVKVRVVTEAA